MLATHAFMLIGGFSLFLSQTQLVKTEGEALSIYIMPADSLDPDCRHASETWPIKAHYCVTLDNFTRYELPRINENATIKKLSLIFLEGIHHSSLPIRITGLKQVVMVGLNSSLPGHNSETVDRRPLIYLSSGNLNVVLSDPVLQTRMEVTYLKINCSGNSTLMINTGGSFIPHISLSDLDLIDGALQIVANNGYCPFVTITYANFVASVFEVYGCLRSDKDKNITITSSTFQISRKQPYAVSLCPSFYDYHASVNVDSYSKLVSYTNVAIKLYNVSARDLDNNNHQSLFLHKPVCNNSLLSNNHEPADIAFVNSNTSVDITIENNTFNRSYGTALRSSENSQTSLFTIINSHFTGYTEGVFIFSGNLNYAVIKLINTTIAKNSINTQGTEAAGLTILSTVYLDNPLSVEITNCVFNQNIDHFGNLQIILLLDISNILISNTVFTENVGTVINAKESNVTFIGDVLFENNYAQQGAALLLMTSMLTFHEYVTITFKGNRARQYGGAVFIDDSNFFLKNYRSTHQYCFYQPSYPAYNFTNATIELYNNTAAGGGDHIYGTSIRNYCRMHFQSNSNAGDSSWKHIFDIDWSSKLLSFISSRPMRVCLCDSNGQPQCTDMSKIFSIYQDIVYPGDDLIISIAIVGAEFGTTTGAVYAKLLPLNSQSSIGNYFLLVPVPQCVTVRYQIKTNSTYETVYLATSNITLNHYGNIEEIVQSIDDFNRTEVIPYSLLTTPVFVNVTLSKTCPVGFTMTENGCECYSELRQINIKCAFVDGVGVLARERNLWIGKTNHTTDTIMYNQNCPSDNCNQSYIYINLNVDNGSESDNQCVFNHHGLLCGSCKDGYSVAIGSSHCLHCTNNNNLALLIFFAAAGPLLYLFIATLDLTITKGTINGVIYYANIVWIYQTIVFSDNVITHRYISIFKVFIAWLNLDFGIETCFIDGLDAFWKTMLQYIFPLYLWFIAWLVKYVYSRISIQYFQDRYPRLSKITGNPTNILTTFIFLSYTKLLRTIVASFGAATLYYLPSNSTELVWAVDGNIPYFKDKHIAVFVLALLSLIFTLFYTLIVLFAGLQSYSLQCKKDQSNWPERFCKLFDMPLPLRDSHFVPLKNEHRYWFGLLLLIRIILLVIHSAMYLYPQPNLQILMITSTILLCYMGWMNVYTNRSLWILHGISLTNLIFLSGALLSFTEVNKKQIIVCISLSITFVQFVAVVFYHFVKCCYKFRSHQDTSYHSQTSAVAEVSNGHTRSSAHIDSEVIEQSVDSCGFRESVLSMNDDSEPLLAQARKKHLLQYLNCCKEPSHSINNLRYPTYS